MILSKYHLQNRTYVRIIKVDSIMMMDTLNLIELNIERIDAITFEVEGYPSHSSDKFKLSLLDIVRISLLNFF